MLKGFLGRHVFYTADDAGGGDAPPAEKPRASDVLEQYGKDALRLAEKLAEMQADNYGLREKNRQLRRDLQDAQGRAPAGGALVLSAEDAARWQAYQALGAPDAIEAERVAAQSATARLTALERDVVIRQAAEAHGYKTAALAKLPSLRDQQITFRDVTADGTTTKRAYVGETALPDFIAANDPEFLPSLADAAPPPAGTPFIRQQSGGDAPTDLASRFIRDRDARRAQQSNPLMPKG